MFSVRPVGRDDRVPTDTDMRVRAYVFTDSFWLVRVDLGRPGLGNVPQFVRRECGAAGRIEHRGHQATQGVESRRLRRTWQMTAP